MRIIKSSLARTAIVLYFLLIANLPAKAQVTTGAILGFVTDSTGASVPGTQVVVTNIDTNYSRTLTSQSAGSYRALLLPPGRYRVSFSKEGFQTFVQEGTLLAVSQEVRVDATLKVGEVSEKITVTTEGAVVDTHSVQLTSPIEAKQLQELPIAGNRFLQLTALSPGVIPPVQGYGVNVTPYDNHQAGNDPQGTGARFNENDYQFDSSHYRNNLFGSSSNMPSSHSVQEVQVIRNSFSAEYGLTSGMVINAVTKSGANVLHGEVYETWGNDILNTRTFTSGSQKPSVRYNQFGASIGGPIRIPGLYNGRDKTFFFFNYEGIRQPGSQLVSGAIPATDLERAGNFSALGEPIIDPVTGQSFPGNVIPPARFDPVGKFVLGRMPKANFGNEYRENFPASRTENQFTVRIDYNLSDKSRLFGRMFLDNPRSTLIPGTMPIFVRSYLQEVRNKDFTLNHVYTFNPNLINQFTFGYTQTPVLTTVPHEGDSYLDFAKVGIQGWNGNNTPPEFLISGLAYIGGASPNDFGDRIYQVTNTASWIHGRHVTKFGLAYSRWRTVYAKGLDRNGEGPGSFFFNGSFTGHPYADLLLGRSSFLYKDAGIPFDGVMRNYSGYVQDDINVNRRLTLNLGLRYQVNVHYEPKNGLGNTFVPGQKSTVVPSAPAGLVFIGDKGIPKSVINTDYNDFSPRVGLAIDPTGKGNMSIRAGYGIYYNLRPAEFSTYFYINPPYGTAASYVPYSLSDPFRGRDNPFPYKFDPNNAQFFFPISLSVADPNLRSGYVHAWNLTLQQKLRGILLETSYVGRAGHKLMSTYLVNPAVYIPGTDANGNPLSTVDNIDQRRIYPGYTTSWYQTSYANSNYHALQVSGRGNLTKSLLMTTAWTWGHSIDDSSSPRYDTAATHNPFNRRLDRGNSDFDLRHIFTASLVWDLPRLNHLPALTRAILGGWNLSTLFKAQSGGWGTARNGQDRALTGIYPPYERANQVLPDIYLPDDRPRGEKFLHWVNPDAFALPAIGTFGNAGRNTILGPGRWLADMSLHKSFNLHEGVLLRFRADAYNVFNHVRLGNCNGSISGGYPGGGSACFMEGDVSSPSFGRFYGAESGRTIQLGGSIEF